MASEKGTSHVALELPSGTSGEIWGLRTLEKSNVVKVRYGERSAYLRHRLFVSKKTEARELLADLGIVVTSNSDWRQILDGIDAIVHFEDDLILEHPGWTGEYYAQPNGKVYAPRGQPKPRVMFARSSEVAAARGTYGGWRERVAQLLTGQDIPMLAVLAGLAAPMLRFAGEQLNFGFEFSGAPETGKSTCIYAMASTTGPPSSAANFNTTMAGLEDMFAAHNDCPFPVDEANLADDPDGKFMKAFAFRMAEGKVKVTRHHSGRAKYRFVFATTSNLAFYARLRGYDAYEANAAFQRLIPISVPPGDGRGVFNLLPEGFDSFGALASQLSQAMECQYGTPMRRLLECLVDTRARDEDALKAQIQAKIHTFETAVGVAGTNRGRTRASTYFGILYAAGCFAKLHAILPEGWNCLNACVAGYRNYQAQLPADTPLASRLLAIARRPETLDLRTQEVPRLSSPQVEEHGSFLRSGTGGRLELLFTEAIKHRYFPDWGQISGTSEFRAMNLRDADHATKQRRIRRGARLERYFCFVLPAALAGGL
jgi:hypothetical protein